MKNGKKTEDKESKFKIQEFNDNTDWNKYLYYLDVFLKEEGFKKYYQDHKMSDFAYWKQYDEKYQIGLLIYDWRKYTQHNFGRRVSVSFECMPLKIDGRCDLCVSKDIELHEFEIMANSFYNTMADYF